jgi:hypothetical protein
LQKFFQTCQVDVPVRRKLEEYWAELLFEKPHPIKISRQRVASVTETLDMRQEPAGLHCEAEIGRCSLTPAHDGGLGGQTVKAVINLDGVEVADVPAQILGGLQLGRVKTPSPMLVVPP